MFGASDYLTRAHGAATVNASRCTGRASTPNCQLPTPKDHGVDRLRVLGRWELWLAGLRRSTSGHGAMRPARGVSSKNAPQAHRPAEAPIRHRRADHPSAQLIGHRRPDCPSRSGHRQAIAGGAFFRASGRGAVARRASAQWVPLTGDLPITPSMAESDVAASQLRDVKFLPSCSSWSSRSFRNSSGRRGEPRAF